MPDSRIYYSQVKGEMEAAVRQAPFRAIHIFRPSLLLGERAAAPPGRAPRRRGAADAEAPAARAAAEVPGRDRTATVAAAMLRAAEDDGGGVRVHEAEELLNA